MSRANPATTDAPVTVEPVSRLPTIQPPVTPITRTATAITTSNARRSRWSDGGVSTAAGESASTLVIDYASVGCPGVLGLVLKVGFEQVAVGSGVVFGLKRRASMNCPIRGSDAESTN